MFTQESSLKIDEWDCQQIERYYMHQPISHNKMFHGIFTRKFEKRFGHPRFYLYSLDSEILYISAEYKGEFGHTTNIHFHKYSISMDSTNFKKYSKSFLGKVKQIGSKVFSAISWHTSTKGLMREVIRIWKTSKDSFQISIPPVGIHRLLGVLDPNYPLPDKEIRLFGQYNDGLYQMKNDDQIDYFLFRQIAEDEFDFVSGYPFTIFQAFSLALIILHS